MHLNSCFLTTFVQYKYLEIFLKHLAHTNSNIPKYSAFSFKNKVRVTGQSLLVQLREDIRKKRLSFGLCPKGGGGVQPESKSFEVVLFSLF